MDCDGFNGFEMEFGYGGMICFFLGRDGDCEDFLGDWFCDGLVDL